MVICRRCNRGVGERSKGSDGVRMGSKGEAIVTRVVAFRVRTNTVVFFESGR